MRRRHVMALPLGLRGMRSYFLAGVFCMGLFIFIFTKYLQLESNISGLDHARRRLEQYLVKLRPSDYSEIHRALLPGTFSVEHGSSETVPLNGDITDDTIVVYNRLPKTASTTLMGFAYDLCEINKYHVLHVNISRNSHILSLADQARFANNISTWVEMKPALYHGHFAFVDFTRFGIQAKPIYINVLRRPLDRLVSYYYFLRYGDDYRPHVVRRKTGDKRTFDECVEKQEADCAPENMWLQVPFFCGHSANCWIPGNLWALETAKHNLINNYLLVGVTEELQDFVTVLEVTLPRFFAGATKLYLSGKKSHLRKTATKLDPLPSTVSKIQASTIWKMENEFYEFALDQFHFVRKKSVIARDGALADRGQKFAYEKIRPK